MNRAAIAADVIDQIRSCLGEGCVYKLGRSRGDAPAEGCNQVTLNWLPRRYEYFSDCQGDSCGDDREQDRLQILVTRCCAGIDGNPVLDFDAEDREEACFWADVELIEDCLRCTDLRELRREHGIQKFRIISTTPDQSVRGGCYSARLIVDIESIACCPTP